MKMMPLGSKVKIIRIPVPSLTLWPHVTTNCYLVGNEKECLLIDAGYDQPETKEMIEQVRLEQQLAIPNRIILTHHHIDHASGVKQLTDWKVAIYSHQEDKEALLKVLPPGSELFNLQDGDLLKVDETELKVIHAPGHTAGHLTFYLPSEEILIAGDTILGTGTPWIGPPDGNMSDYLQTLAKLKSLKLKKIGPGHGEWVDQPYEQIEFIISRRLSREAQIISLLKEHRKLSSDELTKKIYENNIHPSIYFVAKRTTEAHLIKLIRDGIVLQNDCMYQVI